uniref:C1q domain-containing protein n=1 Tax=Echeneis naucrates TaxID=173247 RepID=A0A665UYC4_ECHNA
YYVFYCQILVGLFLLLIVVGVYLCEHGHSFPGTPGLPGPAGPRGLPGAKGMPGPRGLKGDMGDLGHPGDPGSVGEKGEPGQMGECNCTDGLDGDPGQKGDKGDKGHQGYTGPAGQRGPQGDKGDLGPIGLMGLASSYPPPNSPVVFPYVHYNIQGSYNPSNGLYTAPINGTYVFNYHLTVHERVLKVGLFHNFLVWIQVKDSVTNGMYAGTEASSTFSGFLLHPDTCDVALLRAPMPPLMVPEGGYSWGEIPESSTAPASPAIGRSINEP